jgi:hypothetical protein
MSTVVLPNLPETQTTQNKMNTQSTQNVTGTKRSFDATETATPAPVKKERSVAPNFIASRYNWRGVNPELVVKKDKDGKNPTAQLCNSTKQYSFEIMAPPGFCKFVRLGEGGNKGLFKWCDTEKSATLGLVYTNRAPTMRPGETAEAYTQRTSGFRAEQQAFIEQLKAYHDMGFKHLYDNVPDVKAQFTKKARAVLPKDSDDEKINNMALKLYNKYCATHHPIKEDGSGNIEFQIKCSAYKDNKNGTFTPRPVHVYEGCTGVNHHKEHATLAAGDIKDGAVLSPVFAVRLYQTPGNSAFGITYMLNNRHVVAYANGTGDMRTSGPLRDEQLKIRQYAFKGVTSKAGNYNVYVNDLSGAKYLHRTPKALTKYVDLVNGTLGKFPGVTPETAKFTATLLEDATNKEYFDHIEALTRDAATFLFNDPNILPEVKEDLRSTAQEVAAETEQTVEATMLSLFMDTVQSPIKQGDGTREIRCSQRMFSRDNKDEKNTFKYQDEDCDPMDNDPNVEPGCQLSLVLEPKIYVLNTGVVGVKLEIDLDNYIRVLSGGQSIPETGENAMPQWDANMF